MHISPTRESPRGSEAVHDALQTMLETAEYVSDRTTQLATNAGEGMKAGETLGAVARQIRTLSSNTSLEASRLGGSPTVAEIARQMRLLSQQVSVLTEHIMSCLRSQNVALNELNGAMDNLLADTAAAQALALHDGTTTRVEHSATEPTPVPTISPIPIISPSGLESLSGPEPTSFPKAHSNG